VSGMSSGSDGVVGLSSSTDSGHAGVHGRNTGSGPAVFAEGSLYVTGPFLGNVGQNAGAPFPRPAYDSGWQQLPDGWASIELDPGLPVGQYNNRNFVIDMQTRSSSGLTTNWGIGGSDEAFDHPDWLFTRGVWYVILTDNRIRVVNGLHEDYVKTVRVRIWVYR